MESIVLPANGMTTMHRPALLTLGLALVAGAAMAATPVDRLAPLQGDWPSGGSAVTIKGSSGKVSQLSDADRKAGYSVGDILVQGLAYQRTDTLNNGDRRATFAGTCRSPTPVRGPVKWVVSDCALQLTMPAGGGPVRLRVVNGSDLIGGRREKLALAGARGDVAPVEGVGASLDPNDTWSRRRMSPEELAAQDAAARRLNADITARNAAIEARNRKAAADFKAALAARDAEIKANKAAHARQMADYQAKVAARDAAIAKAQGDWQAAVKACKAGDKTKCAQPAKK